jgi:hypothetical protein
MSAGFLARLVVMPVALFLCGLLLSLYIRQWTRSKRPATGHQYSSPFPRKDPYTPATSVGSRRDAGACTAATITRPNYSQRHTQPTVANHSEAHNTCSINRGADVLATLRPARLGSCRRVDASLESPIDPRHPFQLKCVPAGKVSLHLESAWLQPLPPVWAELEGLLEQPLWRNSSGGSSCYSRPASWYGVIVTREPREAGMKCGFRAGPRPTIQADQTTARR